MSVPGAVTALDLGVYVHWPFCQRICPYCDFNVYKDRTINTQQWCSALSAELEFWYDRQEKTDRKLTSLYFGGGTPSLAPLAVIAEVIERCHALWGFQRDAEITLEANPTDFSKSQMQALKALGVNRLSLGVQSFRDDHLEFLGRDHDSASALRAIDMAQDIFGTITFDLIYGMPQQTLVQWREDLERAIALKTHHLSMYQLTIEQGTAFSFAAKRGDWQMQDENVLAAFYEMAIEQMVGAGYGHYEISNFAKHGHKAQHNLLYWHYQDYIGIGPGAHGRLRLKDERLATLNYLKPADYLNACQNNGHGVESEEALNLFEQMQERFALGLRLEDGIDLLEDDYFFTDEARKKYLDNLCGDGLLIWENNRLRATGRGRALLDSILPALGL